MPSSIFYGDNQMLPDALGSSSLFISNSLSVIGTSSFSGPTYVSGDLIVNGEISAGNGSSIGSGSSAEGFNTTASGDYSHTEGDSTNTGIKGYLGSFFVSGVITLSASYGDVSAEFTGGGSVILDDSDYDNIYGRIYLGTTSATYVGPNTEITFNDPSISTTTAIIGLSYDASPLNSNIIFGGYGSHAEGYSTIASGDYSHTEGNITQAVGIYSHAEGWSTQTIGTGTHAEGRGGIASGDYSHAEGNNTIASGSYSHAEGDATQAIGESSHAEGAVTIASGSYSHAEGSGAQAIGDYSHAEGSYTITIGTGSHAGGEFTIASGSYQTVFGSYNIQNNTSSKFTVGIGSSTTRKDGFTVDVDANLSGSIMIPTNTGNPSSPKTGSMYFNPSTNLLYIYNGTAWRSSSFS